MTGPPPPPPHSGGEQLLRPRPFSRELAAPGQDIPDVKQRILSAVPLRRHGRAGRRQQLGVLGPQQRQPVARLGVVVDQRGKAVPGGRERRRRVLRAELRSRCSRRTVRR